MFTFTRVLLVDWQPLASVTVSTYDVVLDGLAVGLAILALLNPVAGVQP